MKKVDTEQYYLEISRSVRGNAGGIYNERRFLWQELEAEWQERERKVEERKKRRLEQRK